MTADVRRRSWLRASALMHASIACIMNAFLRDGGGRQDIAPPILQSLSLKLQPLFPLEGLGKMSRRCTLKNVLLRLPSPPPPLPAEFPKTGTWQMGVAT